MRETFEERAEKQERHADFLLSIAEVNGYDGKRLKWGRLPVNIFLDGKEFWCYRAESLSGLFDANSEEGEDFSRSIYEDVRRELGMDKFFTSDDYFFHDFPLKDILSTFEVTDAIPDCDLVFISRNIREHSRDLFYFLRGYLGSMYMDAYKRKHGEEVK